MDNIARGVSRPARALAATITLGAFTGGCLFSTYEPGALLDLDHNGGASAVTLGCLDVAVRATTDRLVPPRHPVLRFDFGNRCDRPVALDLTRLVVTAVYGGGSVPLYVVDPRNELRPAHLDAHAQGHETLEFAPRVEREDAPASACVELHAITPNDVAPARARRCFPIGPAFTGDPS